MKETQNKQQRKYYLDWLRVIAFYILIFYHVGMIFVPWDFHIKNNVTLEWFETWMAFLSQWRLPLLFLISGMVIYYSLGKRSWKGIITERSKRLLIPLLFGMFVIVPPQIYFERISDGVVFSNYWQFWKTVFELVPFPEGGSLSWHHLWYVLYIFVYSIIALPILTFFKK
jgi:glucan biosynthesis protein C